MAAFLFNLRKGNRRQNRMLALYLLAMSVILGVLIFEGYPAIAEIQSIVNLGIYCTFLLGPLIYFYLKITLIPQFKFKKKDVFHLIPFVVVLITTFVVNIVQGRSITANLLASDPIDLINSIQIIFYLVWTIVELKLHYLVTKPEQFNLTKPKRYWLIFFISSNILILLFRYFSILISFHLLSIPNWCAWLSTLFWLSICIFFYSTVFIALNLPDIFSKSKKYKNTDLPESMKQQCLNKLQNLMDSEKLYRDASLSLDLLAKKIAISPKYLSLIINQSCHQNFYDFVNKHRIDESKKLMLNDTQRKTILEIAYDVGFNSKQTFNKAFKQFTGMTPSAYKKSAIKN